MEIKYNQSQNKLSVMLGVLLLMLNMISVIVYGKFVGFALGLGITYVGMAIYRYYVPYAVVKDGYLKKDFGGKIPLEEITDTRRFAGDYVFRSATKKITLDKNLVDKTSIDALETLINNLRDGKFDGAIPQ